MRLPTTDPHSYLPRLRLRAEVHSGAEMGAGGAHGCWSFQRSRKGIPGPLSERPGALRSSPTTVINSPEKASRHQLSTHNVSIHSNAWGHPGLSQQRSIDTPSASPSLCAHASLRLRPLCACSWKRRLCAGHLGYWGQGKLASGRRQGRPWIHYQEGLWGGGRSPDLGVRRAGLESQLCGGFTG